MQNIRKRATAVKIMKIGTFLVLFFCPIACLFSFVDHQSDHKKLGRQISLDGREIYSSFCPNNYLYYEEDFIEYCYRIIEGYYGFSSCPFIGYTFNLNLIKRLVINTLIPASRESLTEPFVWRTLKNYGELVQNTMNISDSLDNKHCLEYNTIEGLITPVDCETSFNIICLYKIRNNCSTGESKFFKFFTAPNIDYSVSYGDYGKKKMEGVERARKFPTDSKASRAIASIPSTKESPITQSLPIRRKLTESKKESPSKMYQKELETPTGVVGSSTIRQGDLEMPIAVVGPLKILRKELEAPISITRKTNRSQFCQHQLAEFFDPYIGYQLSTYNKPCWFGLVTDYYAKLVWETTGKQLAFNYTPFLENDFVPNNSYGAIYRNKWIFSSDVRNLDCAICQENVKFSNEKLTIHTYLENDAIKIKANHLENINCNKIVCYMGTKTRSFSTRFLVNLGEEVNLNFKDSAYWLWCETIDLRSSQLVKSNFLFNTNMEFANRYSILISNSTWDMDIFTMNNRSFDEIKVICSFECQYVPIGVKQSTDQNHNVDIIFHIISSEPMGKEHEANWIQSNNEKEFGLFTTRHIRKIYVCMEEIKNNNMWPESPIGSMVAPVECSATLVTRTCTGNIIDGAYWSEIHGNYTKCDEETNEIYTLYSSNDSANAIEVLANVSNKFSENFTTMQAHYSALMLINYSSNRQNINSQTHFLTIFDNFFKGDPSNAILYESQKALNSTDILLNSMDLYLENCENDVSVSKDYYHIKKGNLNESVVGWLMLQSTVLKPISHQTSLNEITSQEPLVAIFFSNYLEINEYLGGDVIVSFIFYANSLLFNEETNTEIFHWVASVNIPNFKKKLRHPVRVIMQQPKFAKYKQSCAYWKYGMNEEKINIRGSWSIDLENEAANTQYLICNYTHMTHFGMIVSELIEDQVALHVLTIIGAVLSLTMVSAIVVIVIFKKGYRDTNNLTLLFNYVFSLIILPVALFISSSVNEGTWCILSGMFLHYTVLGQAFWTVVLAICQYKRYVIVYPQHQRHMLKKSCLIGWGPPLIPVAIIASLSIDNYHKNKLSLCYMSQGLIDYSVNLPIFVLTLINTSIFIQIMRSVNKSQKSWDHRNMFWTLLKVTTFLFFLFGLSWILCIILMVTKNIYLNFIFTILTSLQGFCVCAHYYLTIRNMGARLKKPSSYQQDVNSVTTT